MRGLVHLYCGDGKGKTTAAMGLVLRFAGHGKTVCVVQFLKNSPSGEIAALERIPGVTVLRGKAGAPFTFAMNEKERRRTREIHDENFRRACRIAEDGCALLVLDEAVGALRMGLLDRQAVLEFLDHRPENLEIVLTGRGPDAALLERADYITEMKKKKHPFDTGVAAREGVEY